MSDKNTNISEGREKITIIFDDRINLSFYSKYFLDEKIISKIMKKYDNNNAPEKILNSGLDMSNTC